MDLQSLLHLFFSQIKNMNETVTPYLALQGLVCLCRK